MQHSIVEVVAVAQQSSAATQEPRQPKTTASAQQIAASAHELSDNAQALNQLVARFMLIT
jgi:methyl-accepting chemotaxis protein